MQRDSIRGSRYRYSPDLDQDLDLNYPRGTGYYDSGSRLGYGFRGGDEPELGPRFGAVPRLPRVPEQADTVFSTDTDTGGDGAADRPPAVAAKADGGSDPLLSRTQPNETPVAPKLAPAVPVGAGAGGNDEGEVVGAVSGGGRDLGAASSEAAPAKSNDA